MGTTFTPPPVPPIKPPQATVEPAQATIQSRRGKILSALRAQLFTIQQNNGYATNVKNVSLDVKLWEELGPTDCPYLFIIDGRTKYQYHPGTLTERLWYVDIFGVLKQGTQLDMEELIADIETCLMNNVTLSADGVTKGPIDHHRIGEIITDNQLFRQIDGSQLFKITLELVYTAQIGAVR